MIINSKLVIGKKYRGTVRNIESFGVFVNIGDEVGLIHISNLSWNSVNHPNEIVKLKQKIKVIVLNIDADTNRIELGLKQIQKNPWELINEENKIGDIIKCKILSFEYYGLLVELKNGIEVIINISEISWMHHPIPKKERLDFINNFFSIGEEVEAVILSLNTVEHKLELSIKKLTPDPWLNAIEKYTEGSKHSGMVRSISKFGIFILLEEFIEGLIHSTELSWDLKFKHPSEILNIGDKLEVIILENNIEGRKLTLSYKQTIPNPWDQHEIKYAVGTIHYNKIFDIVEKGATIKLEENCIAFIQKSDLKKSDGGILTKEEYILFKVIIFEKEYKRIIVSISQ
jgi:small subunit ribosomal protein S1